MGARINLRKGELPSATKTDGLVKLESGGEFAAIRVEQEDITVVVQDRAGSIHLANRGLAENEARVLQVGSVLIRPLHPVAEKRNVAL